MDHVGGCGRAATSCFFEWPDSSDRTREGGESAPAPTPDMDIRSSSHGGGVVAVCWRRLERRAWWQAAIPAEGALVLGGRRRRRPVGGNYSLVRSGSYLLPVGYKLRYESAVKTELDTFYARWFTGGIPGATRPPGEEPRGSTCRASTGSPCPRGGSSPGDGARGQALPRESVGLADSHRDAWRKRPVPSTTATKQ